MVMRSNSAERRRSSVDIALMREMRDDGASFQDIADVFGLHHTTVMHHLDMLHATEARVRATGWSWSMTPHEVRTAQLMRENGASFAEIGRALHHPKNTVELTLKNHRTQEEVLTWLVPPPPTTEPKEDTT